MSSNAAPDPPTSDERRAEVEELLRQARPLIQSYYLRLGGDVHREQERE